MELVYTADLKSAAERIVGSSPTPGIMDIYDTSYYLDAFRNGWFDDPVGALKETYVRGDIDIEELEKLLPRAIAAEREVRSDDIISIGRELR